MIKIIINTVGQQIIGYIRESDRGPDDHTVEITNPRLIIYRQNETEETVASFTKFCPIAVDDVINYNLDQISCVLNPLPEVLEKYDELINPQEEVFLEAA